ncbi:unnamed protein product [Calypogeia fissa]
MDYYTQKVQQAQQQQHRSSFDSRMDSPRVQNRTSFDAVSTAAAMNNALRHNGGAADQLRASFDARDLSSRASIDIKDVVRASFQKERSRSSVDARDSRESPRLGGGSRYKDPPRSSVDGGRGPGGVDQPVRSSIDSPRLSMRIKEAVRAAVEGRLDSVRSSFDSKESLRSASTNNRPREASTTPRSHSTGDSRLLVELRESPRLSRDAPRYSCDGRDVLRSTPALVDINNNCYTNSILRGIQKASRESPRLSVDGRGGPSPPVAVVRAYIDERESPRLPRELLHASSRESSQYQTQSLRSDSEGKERGHLLQQSDGEPRRRVPSLVARLMGLEDLPDDVKHTHHPPSLTQQMATSVVLSHETAALAPQQSTMSQKKPSSKESKLLKGLLQYNPRTEEPRSETESRHELHQAHTQEQVKHVFGPRQPQPENLGGVHDHYQQQPFRWNGIQQESPRQLKLSPKQLAVETMPNAYKHLEAREMGALRQKVANGMPKQLTEAVLTVLKNADETKRMPMSYSEMESRLRQLRLRSSFQEHKSLRQILEAMQSKGLLNGASRPKDGYTEEEERQAEEEVRQQQYTPKNIMSPKPQQECSPEAPHASKVKHIQELRKLGSRLHEQVFGTLSEESVKPTRPLPQLVSSKLVRTTDEQQQSIVVMKPIVKPAKKTTRAQNPALILESMPSARSSLRGRETGGRTSPWGSPVRTQPLKAQPGFGFGRESTGRFISEEGATAFKMRRERILARSGARDVHSEPSTPRSPKLITLPQSAAKPRSSSVIKETPEGLRHVKVNSCAGSKVGESGRRSARCTAPKEESPKSAPLRSQSGRDFVGFKKPHAAVMETEQQQQQQQQQQPQKELKSRRGPSDGKVSAPNDRDGNNKASGPGEVVILRNKLCMGKRVTLPEPETRTSTTTTAVSKRVVNGVSKLGPGEKAREKTSSGSAPTTPKGSLRNAAEQGRKKEEQGGGTLDHVRVTDGDALDQSNVRSPLVGLTNRLQSTQSAFGELDREGQGVRTPRGGILVKRMFANQESNVQAEAVDIPSEQAQPSPVSVLDAASFHEEDVSPLALNTPVQEMQDHCDEKLGDDHHIVQQADTALQDWRHKVYLADDRSLVNECSEQLMFLRESAKILPPQGELKSLILQSQAEKVYVRDVLVVSGASMGLKAINPSGGMIDNTVFDYLEEKQGSADYGMDLKDEPEHDLEKCDEERERQVMDRRMLFDCVNDALTTVLVPFVNPQPWMQSFLVKPLRKRPTGQLLVQQVWDELKALPPEKPSDDICDSLYNVLQKDLVLPRNSWTEFNDEVEDIGLEVEKMIFKDLVEETLLDITQKVRRKGVLAR